jgi:hypothetical protein
MLDDKAVLGLMLDPSFGQSDIKHFFYTITGPLGRPVSMATFVGNALLSGDLFYWKFVNLVIHIACGFLIYLVLDRLLTIGRRVFQEEKSISLIPFCISIVWLLHPLHVSTVLYTVQRMTQLSTLFTLAALLTYLVARQRQLNNQRFLLYQVITWTVLFPLGIFSKENALLFPVFLILIELFYINSQKLSNKKVLLMMSAFLGSGLAFCIAKADQIVAGYIRRDFSLLERLMTEPRVLVDYIGMLLLPAQQRMGFMHDDYVISKGLLDPWTTSISILLILFLISTAFYIRKKMPLVSLGIVFFFAGHALESTVLSLELVFEHRNYLPSLGVFMAVAGLVRHFVESKILAVGGFGFVVVILMYITSARVETWSSEIAMDYYIGMVHPKSERMASKMAGKWAGYKEYDSARKILQPLNSLGVKIHRLDIDCLEKKQLRDEQLNIDMSQYKVADNYVVRGVSDIANAGLDDECEFSPAVFISFLDNILTKTVTPASNRQVVLIYKAHYLWSLGFKQKAIMVSKETYKYDGSNPIPLFMACEWLLDIEDYKQGPLVCNDALLVASRNMSRHGDLYRNVKQRLDAVAL